MRSAEAHGHAWSGDARTRYEEFAHGIKAQRAARRKAQQEGKSLFSDDGSFGLDEDEGRDHPDIEKAAKLRPSEYFARQVTVAASFMNSHEASIRNEIGVGNLMWGADFPHAEGTWPRTRKSLARCFAGVPPEDVRAILAENPARLYGFDVAALQPIADRVGPTLAELVGRV